MELEDGSVEAQVATGQGETGQIATGQMDAGEEPVQAAAEPTGENAQDAAEKETRLDQNPRFQEVIREKNQYKEAFDRLQGLLYQQQMAQSQSQGQQVDPFKSFLEENGIGRDGYVTPDDLQKVAGFFDQQRRQETLQTQQQQWLASHPDYSQIVTTQTGGMSEHLMNAIKLDPNLGLELQRNWDPVKAYYAALAAQTQTPSAPVPQVTLNQVRTGQRPPQGISTATGGGGSMDSTSSVNAMTDDQFRVWWATKRGSH